MSRRTLGKTWLLLALAAAACGGCGDRGGGLAPVLPDAPPEVAAALAAPAGPAFARWARAASADRLVDVRGMVVDALHGPERAAGPVRAELAAALAALDAELADGCGLPAYAAESARLATLPPDSAAAVVAAFRELQEAFVDPEPEPAAKLARIETLQARLLAAGHVRAAAEGWYDLAFLHHRAGDAARWRRCHRSSVALAREHGCFAIMARAWGQLMMGNMSRGWTAAERDTLNRLVERARAARLAGPSTYLISLQAYDAFNQGRYGTARSLFESGIAVCRELNDPDRALPTVDLLLRLYALLECWNQVDQLLLRAEQMQADTAAGSGPVINSRSSRMRHAGLEARSLAARGRIDEAHAAFADAFALAEALPFSETDYLGQQWVAALMAADRPDLARDALGVIAARNRAGTDGTVGLHLPLWRAWLAWRGGDTAAATAALDSFAATAASASPLLVANLRLQADALRARVLAPARPDSAEAVLTAGWSRLFRRIHARESSPEAYLDLARNNHLRAAAQDLLGDDPATGYGLELLWRTSFLPRWPVPADPGTAPLGEAARAAAARARADLAARDAVHCLYRVQRARVVRWTADARGVVRDVLPASPDRLRALVTGALARLGRDPGDADAPVPPELAAELAGLARELLPARLLAAGSRPAVLYVSGDSFLAQFPFSTLNLDADGYRPLVRAMDVAWVRGGPAAASAPAPGAACGAALVVADPTVDPATRRRFGLPAGLPGAAAELAAISGRLPDARVLSGDRATRAGVTAAWDAAAVLYFVGHAVRDAEVPFSAWLPLAAGEDGVPYPGLDLTDVLGARLDRCRLVVLSGCATGAPYVDGLSETPSLGDAFLDAGAGAAIQTFWRVRDEGGAFAPERILAAWQEGRADLAAAVSAERRRAMDGPRGIRHPFDWAAWTLKTAWFAGP